MFLVHIEQRFKEFCLLCTLTRDMLRNKDSEARNANHSSDPCRPFRKEPTPEEDLLVAIE